MNQGEANAIAAALAFGTYKPKSRTIDRIVDHLNKNTAIPFLFRVFNGEGVLVVTAEPKTIP